jgi:hypothetical protein
VIIFVVLLVDPVPDRVAERAGGLKAREERIRRDIADAEAARAKAEATLKDTTRSSRPPRQDPRHARQGDRRRRAHRDEPADAGAAGVGRDQEPRHREIEQARTAPV